MYDSPQITIADPLNKVLSCSAPNKANKANNEVTFTSPRLFGDDICGVCCLANTGELLTSSSERAVLAAEFAGAWRNMYGTFASSEPLRLCLAVGAKSRTK